MGRFKSTSQFKGPRQSCIILLLAAIVHQKQHTKKK